jgi:hypothetical protein
MITVQDAIRHLYQVAVLQGATQSPSRLRVLADYCVQELAVRGMPGVLTEQIVPGGGRQKNWDVAWPYDGKYRLAISLKSMLKNLPGTVPNRIDDLMGEVANAQLHSPEIVTGYVMLVDVSEDMHSPRHGSTWTELLRTRLQRLSGREPPHWTVGTIEAYVLAEVDFSSSAILRTTAEQFDRFFDILAEQVRTRNPNAVRRDG